MLHFIFVYAGNTFYVKGHYLYEHNNGHLAMSKDNRLGAVRYGVHALERIPGVIAQYQERNAKLAQDIAEYQRIAGKPWGKEDDLKGLKTELDALEKQIQASLDETTKNMPKPEELPYKFSKEGRYHKVTFAREAYPFVSISEMREMADTGSWRNRGYVRCGHWDGDLMVSDPEVEGEFTLRQKCEEFMQQIVDTNKQRMEDKEWLVNMANNDTEGDKVCQDNEVIFAARKYLQEHNIDWHTGEDVAVSVEPETKAETVEIAKAAEKPIVVYSLGQYGVGERGEELRTLAHQVKEGGSNDAITEAVNQLSDLFEKIPEAERERMVLVPMPGKTGIPGYTDDIAYDLGDYMEIDSNSSLISSPHPSLYELKKENGNDNLPKIDFTFNDELSEGTIVVLVDNVLDTGHTLSQAAQANFGKGVEVRAVVLAHTDNYLQYHPELEVKMPLAQEIEKKPVVSQPVRIAAQVVKQEQKVEMPSLGLRDALIERMRGAGIDVNLDAAEGERVLEKYKDQANESRKPILFRDKEGQVYGFVHEGKVYLDPNVATVETPIHEYTHLWAEVLHQQNPKEWEKVVQMMKDTPEVWNDVKSQYPNLHTDDEIASEALAQYSGQRGTQRLQEFVADKENAAGIFEKVSEVLSKFWNAVADFLHIEYTNKEEVADRVLYDLLNGVNPLRLGPKVQGLEDYTQYEVKQMVEDYVNEKLAEDFPGEDIYVKQVTIIGSRSRGEAKEGSDLDILLEYGGEGVKEDALFNVLNENRLEINGISVDINPINPYYSMNTAEWLARDVKWREEDSQKSQLTRQHDEVVQQYKDAELTNTPVFLLKEAELLRKDTGEMEKYSAVTVDPPYIMLYEGMDAAAKSEGAMMLTDFSPEVQKQVLKELSDGLKSSQERSAVEHICGLANDAKLDYLPLALRVPVMVPKFFDGLETKDRVLSHAIAVGDDIELFENREDAYDHRNQLYLKDLPEEARQQVICLMDEVLTSEDQQITVQVDTVKVPEYALSAIINGDFSNLDAEEAEDVQAFLDKYPGHIFSPREESPSFYQNPAFGKPTGCVKMDIVRLATIKQLREEKVSIVTEDKKEKKAAIKQEQSDACISSAEREQARPKVKEEQKALDENLKKEKEQKAEDQKALDEIKKKEDEKRDREAKESAGKDVAAAVVTASLIVGALEMAKTNKGVWMNKCCNLSDDVVTASRLSRPYEALTMVLQNDTKGECPKVVALNREAQAYHQVQELKEKHPDAMILMRNGDFYEAFGEDAEKASRILGIALSKQSAGRKKFDYTSFPHHALDIYLPKLVRAGLRIAICDALVDPKLNEKEAKPIYDQVDELVTALKKSDDRIQVNPLLLTDYDSNDDGLLINNSRKAAVGEEKETAIERANDIYRAAIAYTGAPQRLNRQNQPDMTPAEAHRYDRLVQELAAGVIMARQNLPAQLSSDSLSMIPDWQQQLQENPQMVEHLEHDMNDAIRVLGKIMKGEDIDYAAMRGEEPQAVAQGAVAEEVSRSVSFEQVSMTRDDRDRYVLYVKPADEKAFTIYPEREDIDRFFQSFRTPEFDTVRSELAQKYYQMVVNHPESKADVLMPKVPEGADLSRISKVNITKDRYHEGATIMFATIDGERQKPVELSKSQIQRFWLSEDREAFKVALAAQLFQNKLCVNQSQQQTEPVAEAKDGAKVAESEPEPKRTMHL